MFRVLKKKKRGGGHRKLLVCVILSRIFFCLMLVYFCMITFRISVEQPALVPLSLPCFQGGKQLKGCLERRFLFLLGVVCGIDRPSQSWPPTQPATVISLYFKSFQSSQEVYNRGRAELSVYKYSLSSMVQNSKNKQIIYIQGTWVVRKQTQALVMPITSVLEKSFRE